MDLIFKWQELIGAFAGAIIGFAAAIFAVRWTLLSERRREEKEFISIKRALGSEIRQYAHQARDAHNRCKALAQSGHRFTVNDIMNAGRFPPPVIYPNAASRLGLIGDEAHWIVFFYAQIQVFVEQREQMKGLADPLYTIPTQNAVASTDALLSACEAAVHVLPLVRVGDFYTGQDEKFTAAVAEARNNWQPDQRTKFTNPMS
jgi:type II secretory pathway pseudopilin PulG